jgi:hypothetical protein
VADTLVRYIGLIVRNNPARPAETVLYRSDVLRVIDEQLGELHRRTADLASASYQAGMRLARTTLRGQFQEWGYPAPVVDLWPSHYLDAVLADLDRAADRTKTNLLWLASQAYRGVSADAVSPSVPNVSAAVGQLRALAVAAAISQALNTWARSALAAVAVLVTRGLSEITVDTFNVFAQQHPALRVVKQWQTTSADPCATCRMLHGTELPLDRQFDHTALGSTPPVFRDLLAPPRHPNCACKLLLIIVPAVQPVAA